MTNKLVPIKPATDENEIPMQATAGDGEITLRFNQGVTQAHLQQLAENLQEGIQGMFEDIRAKIDHDSKATRNQIVDVKNTIKAKHISPQDLSALESLVSDKAKRYVEKSGGIQLNIDTVLNNDVESLKDIQKLIKREHGRIKQRIWVELNKDCLERKGTDPKNRIRDTQVEQAFDFVRTWGGFSL